MGRARLGRDVIMFVLTFLLSRKARGLLTGEQCRAVSESVSTCVGELS